MRKIQYSKEKLLIVLIYILFPLFSGCFSPGAISGSGLPQYLNSYCEVHAIDTTYWLYNTRIEGDTLIGVIGNHAPNHKASYYQVYLRSESWKFINSDKTLIFIPLSDVVNAKKSKMPNGLAALLGIGIGMAFMFLKFRLAGMI